MSPQDEQQLIAGGVQPPQLLAGSGADHDECAAHFWDSHDVYERMMGEKQLRVDGTGILRLKFGTFARTGPEGHVLYVYFPQPDSTDDEALRNLT